MSLHMNHQRLVIPRGLLAYIHELQQELEASAREIHRYAHGVRAHTHTHTHSYDSHSHSHSHSHARTLTRSCTRTHMYWHSLTHAHTLKLTHTHTHTPSFRCISFRGNGAGQARRTLCWSGWLSLTAKALVVVEALTLEGAVAELASASVDLAMLLPLVVY